ncbi:hypothetical protein GCK32_008186 [Trichostrongylus colubriformis]|uniref:Uncharacterized protein n=1 Tax=Trichostrongylus colubriformis TaxID=6319 RepID=A0AAN8IXZ3_TRICO
MCNAGLMKHCLKKVFLRAGEVQILDYQTQQFRLLPQLARAFAFMFAAYEIRDLYMKVTEQLTHGNVDLLPEIHALSSGLKFLIKAAEEVRGGNARLAEICGYLARPDAAYSKFNNWHTYSDSDIVQDFEHVARKQVFRAYDTLKRHQRETSTEEAWNRASIELCKASRVGSHKFTINIIIKLKSSHRYLV